jgi:hypothetical protein
MTDYTSDQNNEIAGCKEEGWHILKNKAWKIQFKTNK